MFMKFFIFFILFSSFSFPCLCDYPGSWWRVVPRDLAARWEVLPQDAQAGEVVLSKRTELGVFSNLALTPFIFEGETYASIEAFWQMMKFPEADNEEDMRNGLPYLMERDNVKKLYGFKAKNAGDSANKIMRQYDINFISYKGKFFDYKDYNSGSDYHYDLIYSATLEKIKQNPKLEKLLLKTWGLKLIPDHRQKASPASYYYHEILMEIRSSIFEHIRLESQLFHQ